MRIRFVILRNVRKAQNTHIDGRLLQMHEYVRGDFSESSIERKPKVELLLRQDILLDSEYAVLILRI